MFLTSCGAEPTPVPERSDAEYIFVHGLSGWGSYDKTYKRMPYWGMFGGDLMKFLRAQGFSCYAASVSPGIWQVMPTYHGDHMSLQGGMMKRNNIRPFYLELLVLIDTLPEG